MALGLILIFGFIFTFNKKYKTEEKISFIKSLEKVANWEASLRYEKDYLQHTTEVIVPKFANGRFLIIASETNDINDENIFGTATFQATNLTLIENNFDGKYNYQLVDRNTGKPIKKAKIHLKNKVFKNSNHINKKLTTDRLGFASFKSDEDYRNVNISVKTKNDIAFFGNHYFYEYHRNNYRDNNENEIIIKPFNFTDKRI